MQEYLGVKTPPRLCPQPMEVGVHNQHTCDIYIEEF